MCSGPAVTTEHVVPDRYMGWCGTGSWTGVITGWYRSVNFTARGIRVGTSTTAYLTIPAYTSNILNSAQTLRYVAI